MWGRQTRSLPLTPTQPGGMTTLVPSALRERAGRGRHFASLRDLLHTNAAVSPFSTPYLHWACCPFTILFWLDRLADRKCGYQEGCCGDGSCFVSSSLGLLLPTALGYSHSEHACMHKCEHTLERPHMHTCEHTEILSYKHMEIHFNTHMNALTSTHVFLSKLWRPSGWISESYKMKMPPPLHLIYWK